MDYQQIGAWSMANVTSGVVGIHAALLPDSKVLLWERFHGLHAPSLYPPNPYTLVPEIGQSEVSTEVDLLRETFTPKHADYSPFCSGSAQMADGSILIVGGDGDGVGNGYIKDGRYGVRTYTSRTGWVDVGKLQQSRWYPTVTMIGRNRYIAVGGHTESYVPTDLGRSNPTYEFWPPYPSGIFNVPILTDTYPYNTYPVVFLLPSGNVFMFAGVRASILNTQDLTMKELPSLKKDFLAPSRSFPYLSQSVMLPLTPANNYTATILICGGTEKGGKASTSCSMIQPDFPNPKWVDIENMPVARVMGDAVLLPTGNVLFVNGAKWGTADGAAGYGMSKYPAFEAVEYDESAEFGKKWKTLASATVPRLYHSSALLLLDGRVATFGSDQQNFEESTKDPFEYRIEYFNPWYTLTPSMRPVIQKYATMLTCDQTFELAFRNVLKIPLKVIMIRYGTSTHSSNMDSRFVELVLLNAGVSKLGEGKAVAQAPRNGNIAPSGNWLLFLSAGGVPSYGVTVNLLCE
ncbi:hypothetical protein HDU67_000305 [Dinochytrium kinnereticum]|nr:hypothetical protein HDU67_000305 [Dinochytrium kinnereticum]